jgi:hypothetical protein
MPSSANNQEQIRLAIEAVSAAVREMTPVGAKAIPVSPVRFNLLARPHKDNCGICKYQAHFNTIRPKAIKFLHEHDVVRFQQVSKKLNDLLLKGETRKTRNPSIRLASC